MLGSDGYNDKKRIKVDESRRGIAGYVYPMHNKYFVELLPQLNQTNLNLKFATAVAAYVFRLKLDVLDIFEQHRKNLWPIHVGGDRILDCGGICPDDTNIAQLPVWSFHVRHGDVKELKDIYQNRRVFEFKDFYFLASNYAETLIDTAQYSKLPAAIFVASDSDETVDFIKYSCSNSLNSDWPVADIDIDNICSLQVQVPDCRKHHGLKPPCIFASNSTERFRTKHGSHTVAALGGCIGQSCALYYQDILYYQENSPIKHLSKAEALMLNLFESIEDLYFMSTSDTLITQMSSHYSTFASLLIWARLGGMSTNTVKFIDYDLVEAGIIHCTFLHGGFKGTSQVVDGSLRWISFTKRFFEGLSKSEDDIANQIEYRMTMKDSIPHINQELFFKESRRWLGQSDIEQKNNHTFAGECPLQPSDDTRTTIASLINWGADHNEIFHYNQALICWETALNILKKLTKSQKRDLTKEAYDQFEDVLIGNIKAVRNSQLGPYSNGIVEVKKLLSLEGRKLAKMVTKSEF